MRGSGVAVVAGVVALVVAGSVAAVAAVSSPSASCTVPTGSAGVYRTTCTISVPQATATVTQTVAGPTVTRTVTAAPTVTPTATTASPTPTATAPTSAFPTAATTGVPAGTTLTTVKGDLASSSSGQTITGKLITGDFIAGDSNVTLKNSRVLGRVVNQSKGLTVIDSDIGPDACPSGPSDYNNLGGSNYTLTRVHVHNSGADLIGIGGTGTINITDSLIDRACFYPGDHLDAAQFYSPGDLGKVTITHSVLDVRATNASDKGNSAIFWADNPAAGSTLTVTGSKLVGGNYTLALYDAGTFTITGNTFMKGSYQYGPCITNKAVTFTGNKYDDGSPLTSC